MAGIGAGCYLNLSLGRNLGASLLVFDIHRGGAVAGKPFRRRNLVIKAEVNFVNAEEAKKLIAEGYAILDVRDKTQYNRAHIKDCYHAPLFIENQDNDLGTIIKRTVHNNFSGLFFGLAFTKLNPDFVQSVKSQFSPESKLLLVCQEGLRCFQQVRGSWLPEYSMHNFGASICETRLKSDTLVLDEAQLQASQHEHEDYYCNH